jgi:AcrR family transcriptional regulator
MMPIAHLAPASTTDTREKILNTAAMLFARDGFGATSLRDITATAGVNIAAVNYYFGSKDNLIVAVLSRAIRPLNERRLALLDTLLREAAPEPPALRKILEALLRPCIEMGSDPAHRETFQLLERSLSEEGNFIKQIIQREWNPVVARFIEAMDHALPDVPQEEVFWRIHFTMGALIHTMCHHQDLTLISEGRCRFDPEQTLARITDYAAAGLLAARPHPRQP